ncbi:Rieske 2Fe-2S domain-containing protein [Catenulispora yoronensis]
MDIGGEHCAAYRDASGILHLVSAVCSHLGGTVGFNDVEKTWECPCHGSRFAPDGAVLQGPRCGRWRRWRRIWGSQRTEGSVAVLILLFSQSVHWLHGTFP